MQASNMYDYSVFCGMNFATYHVTLGCLHLELLRPPELWPIRLRLVASNLGKVTGGKMGSDEMNL